MADRWVVDPSRTTSTTQSTTSLPTTSPTLPFTNLASAPPSNTRLSDGALGGIIAASVIVSLLLVGLLWLIWRRRRNGRASKAIDTEGSAESLGTDAEGMSRGDTSGNVPVEDSPTEPVTRGRDPTPRPLPTTALGNQDEPTAAALNKSPGPGIPRSSREPRFSEE
ncbi:hypothetical protein GQ607_009955 [Colletotrichum asianum]|uniref:Uncharacterized protein n=1 Tax=Colletotrichum asianum TaxID=702518 RepID=A0A8H3W8Z8_9PEZI|nr:hypothetical protein GQ607_009955 [Colletotrichum asianum]